MQLNFRVPKHDIGSEFMYRPNRHAEYKAKIVGYHIEHNTDTFKTDVTYRVRYNFAGLQMMTVNLSRATVDRAMLSLAKQAQKA